LTASISRRRSGTVSRRKSACSCQPPQLAPKAARDAHRVARAESLSLGGPSTVCTVAVAPGPCGQGIAHRMRTRSGRQEEQERGPVETTPRGSPPPINSRASARTPWSSRTRRARWLSWPRSGQPAIRRHPSATWRVTRRTKPAAMMPYPRNNRWWKR
jgi:hypothetical protein